jgi:hypothetical protein
MLRESNLPFQPGKPSIGSKFPNHNGNACQYRIGVEANENIAPIADNNRFIHLQAMSSATATAASAARVRSVSFILSLLRSLKRAISSL